MAVKSDFFTGLMQRDEAARKAAAQKAPAVEETVPEEPVVVAAPAPKSEPAPVAAKKRGRKPAEAVPKSCKLGVYFTAEERRQLEELRFRTGKTFSEILSEGLRLFAAKHK